MVDARKAKELYEESHNPNNEWLNSATHEIKKVAESGRSIVNIYLGNFKMKNVEYEYKDKINDLVDLGFKVRLKLDSGFFDSILGYTDVYLEVSW